MKIYKFVFLLLIIEIRAFAKKDITIIGANYVGLVLAATLSQFGYKVTCVDIDKTRIINLKAMHIPIFEPNLQKILFESNYALTFDNSLYEAATAKIIYICVGTPLDGNGNCDVSAIYSVIDDIANLKHKPDIICVKSTVSPGTLKKLKDYLKQQNLQNIELVYNPEFLREGSAITDILTKNPIVIGGESEIAKAEIISLFKPILDNGAFLINTSFETAEIIKYAWNSFSATRITFINELATICKKYNADIFTAIQGIAQSEKLLPTSQIKPGPGFGGSCFPKDTVAFTKILEQQGLNQSIVHQTIISNDLHIKRITNEVIETVKRKKSKVITILGLSFKANTDDIRKSPSIDLISSLLNYDFTIQAYDPKAINNMRKIFPHLKYYDSAYKACINSDCVIIMNEWQEFKDLDLNKISNLCQTKILFDLRNLYDPKMAISYGFEFYNLGRI